MTMSRFRFHKLAAIVVLIGFAAWVATGTFSSVGSAAGGDEQKAAEGSQKKEQPKAEEAPRQKQGDKCSTEDKQAGRC